MAKRKKKKLSKDWELSSYHVYYKDIDVVKFYKSLNWEKLVQEIFKSFHGK